MGEVIDFRVAYTLNGRQPVTSTLIGKDPLFYSSETAQEIMENLAGNLGLHAMADATVTFSNPHMKYDYDLCGAIDAMDKLNQITDMMRDTWREIQSLADIIKRMGDA